MRITWSKVEDRFDHIPSHGGPTVRQDTTRLGQLLSRVVATLSKPATAGERIQQQVELVKLGMQQGELTADAAAQAMRPIFNRRFPASMFAGNKRRRGVQ